MQRRSTVLGLVWLHRLEGAGGGGGGRGGGGLLIVADQMHGFLEQCTVVYIIWYKDL